MTLSDQIRADREAGKHTATMNGAFQRRVQRLVELEDAVLAAEAYVHAWGQWMKQDLKTSLTAQEAAELITLRQDRNAALARLRKALGETE